MPDSDNHSNSTEQHSTSDSINENTETQPQWINSHGVPCVLCGGIADKRSATHINKDEITPGYEATNPEATTLIQNIIDRKGTGETHPYCFEIALNQGLDHALNSLEERTSQT